MRAWCWMILNIQHIAGISMNTELVRERVSHVDLWRFNDHVCTPRKQDQQPCNASEHQPEKADDERASIADRSRSQRSDYAKRPRRHLEPCHDTAPWMKQSATACALSTR